MTPADELLSFVRRFVRTSDAMAHEWSDGDWRAVLTTVRDLTKEARVLLAKAEGATAPEVTCSECGLHHTRGHARGCSRREGRS